METLELKETLTKLVQYCSGKDDCTYCPMQLVNEYGDEECFLNLFSSCDTDYLKEKINEIKEA